MVYRSGSINGLVSDQQMLIAVDVEKETSDVNHTGYSARMIPKKLPRVMPEDFMVVKDICQSGHQ